MISTATIAWVAGLLEGEGYFYRNGCSPGIRITMTDPDVVAQIATIFDHRMTQHPKQFPNRKQPWKTGTWGPEAAGWMMTCYVFMGLRRREKIREILAAWRSSPEVRGLRCRRHPDRPSRSHGRCRNCYTADRQRGKRKRPGRYVKARSRAGGPDVSTERGSIQTVEKEAP